MTPAVVVVVGSRHSYAAGGGSPGGIPHVRGCLPGQGGRTRDPPGSGMGPRHYGRMGLPAFGMGPVGSYTGPRQRVCMGLLDFCMGPHRP